MRVLLLAITLLLAGVAGANATDVTVAFVTDPLIEGGGYWEATVVSTESVPMYWLIIGNTGADVIFTEPDKCCGNWSTRRDSGAKWNNGLTWSQLHPSATPLNTAAAGNEFETLFPGQAQALSWYTATAGSPIAAGDTESGFRFKYPSSAASSTSAAMPGTPYALFNAAGELQASGITSSPPVPAEVTTWGRVKALYR